MRDFDNCPPYTRSEEAVEAFRSIGRAVRLIASCVGATCLIRFRADESAAKVVRGGVR